MSIEVRPLAEPDLPEADRIFRLAFGTFVGLPDPMAFAFGADWVGTRWRADPSAILGAYVDGEVAGSNCVVNWGSFGLFGPLTIRPDLWDRGIVTRLLEPTMDLFTRWGIRQAGLYTFAHSTKHVHLYQKFGFWPQHLTVVMSTAVARVTPDGHATRFSADPNLAACRELTYSIYDGLDLEREILAVEGQKLGDTVLVWDGARVVGLAVCHCGAGTEAGYDTCYVKFGAARTARDFDRLLDACFALAAERSLARLTAGVNTARHGAYHRLRERGFRAEFQGVAMQRPNECGFNRPDAFVLDDWR